MCVEESLFYSDGNSISGAGTRVRRVEGGRRLEKMELFVGLQAENG